MDTRVFWSVLCALLVFSGLAALGSAVLVSAQREAAQHAADRAAQVARVTQQQEGQAEQERVLQQAAYQRWLHERERLQPDQRCIGGFLFQVHGTAYTQLGYPGHPAHCQGQYADQPTR